MSCAGEDHAQAGLQRRRHLRRRAHRRQVAGALSVWAAAPPAGCMVPPRGNPRACDASALPPQDFIVFYSWDGKLIRRIDANVKGVYWSDNGEQVGSARFRPAVLAQRRDAAVLCLAKSGAVPGGSCRGACVRVRVWGGGCCRWPWWATRASTCCASTPRWWSRRWPVSAGARAAAACNGSGRGSPWRQRVRDDGVGLREWCACAGGGTADPDGIDDAFELITEVRAALRPTHDAPHLRAEATAQPAPRAGACSARLAC